MAAPTPAPAAPTVAHTVAAIEARIGRIEAERDLWLSLAPAAGREIRAYVGAWRREHDDGGPPAAYALGRLYWYRGQAAPRWAVRTRRVNLRMARRFLSRSLLAGMEPFPGPWPEAVVGNARAGAARDLRRAMRDRAPERIERCVVQWRRVAAVAPPGDAATVEGLCAALSVHWDHTGDPALLDEIIAACRRATPTGVVPQMLAMALLARFELRADSANLPDVEEAISLLRTAADAARGPQLPVLLSFLGGAGLVRAEYDAGSGATDEAVAVLERAVSITKPRHPLAPLIRGQLGNALLRRYQLRGDAADVERGTRLLVEASESAALADEAVAAAGLGMLAATALGLESQRGGSVPELDRSVTFLRKAVAALPPGNTTYRSRLLIVLSQVLAQRFLVGGSVVDLDAAIAGVRSAADTMAPTGIDRAKALSLLCQYLGARYESLGADADLDAVVDAGRACLDATPDRHSDRPLHLGVHGAALALRYRVRGETEDCDGAVWCLQEAVDTAEPGSSMRNQATAVLAQVLRNRARRSGAVADFERGAGLLRETIERLAGAPHDRCSKQIMLGGLLADRYHATSEPEHAEAALALLAEVADSPDAAPSHRIEAADGAADLEQVLAFPGWEARAARRLELAVGLLPRVTARTLARTDRQRTLGDLSGLASRAAALALHDHRPDESDGRRAARALGLLEAGRAVLLSQAYETRTDLSAVHRAAPDLAARFVELRDALDRADGTYSPLIATADDTLSLEAAAGDRRRTALDLADTIDAIRRLKGQDRFLLPPLPAELVAEASDGPLVVLNTTELRSDALLVTPDGIRALRLPELTLDDAMERSARFRRALDTYDAPAMSAVLEWLWDVCAEPVLDALGLTTAPGAEWPRVWWAPGGPLVNLPIHAAGYHRLDGDPPTARTVMDRAVSSYIPTIRTLSHLRTRAATIAERARTSADHAERANRSERADHAATASGQAEHADRADRTSLVIAMSETPGGRRPLGNARREADFLRGLLPGVVVLASGTGDPPTAARVVEELAGCELVHFACHAEADPADPSRSGLLLQDRLTVSMLSAVNLDTVRLAFLSACGTALNRAGHLLEESVHLASALQLAGFPHVVGTLWEVEDFAAFAVAESFYTNLRDADGELEPARAARVLHGVSLALREAEPESVWLWASHVHAGA